LRLAWIFSLFALAGGLEACGARTLLRSDGSWRAEWQAVRPTLPAAMPEVASKCVSTNSDIVKQFEDSRILLDLDAISALNDLNTPRKRPCAAGSIAIFDCVSRACKDGIAKVKIQFLADERARLTAQLAAIEASAMSTVIEDGDLEQANRAYLTIAKQLVGLVTDHRHVITRDVLGGVARGLDAFRQLLSLAGQLDKPTYLRRIEDLGLDVEAKLSCFDESKGWFERFLDLERSTERLVRVRAIDAAGLATGGFEVWYNSAAGDALGSKPDRFPTISVPAEFSLSAGRYLFWLQSFDGKVASQKLRIQVKVARQPMYIDLPVLGGRSR
jgi:hypothetical protein